MARLELRDIFRSWGKQEWVSMVLLGSLGTVINLSPRMMSRTFWFVPFDESRWEGFQAFVFFAYLVWLGVAIRGFTVSRIVRVLCSMVISLVCSVVSVSALVWYRVPSVVFNLCFCLLVAVVWHLLFTFPTRTVKQVLGRDS
jgi:hypothetical protein